MTKMIARPVQGDAPEQLAAWRARRALTQTAAASELGCSQNTYSEIERGLLYPNEEIRRACKRVAAVTISSWGPRPTRRRLAPSAAPVAEGG